MLANGDNPAMHPDFSGNELINGKRVYYGIPVNRVDSNPAKGQKFPSGRTVFDAEWGDSDSDNGEQLLQHSFV